MNFTYRNLQIGTRFTIPGDPENRTFVRVRGGFCLVAPDGLATGFPLTPGNAYLKDGLSRVNPVVEREAGKVRDEERKKLNDWLEATPHTFVPDEFDPRFGDGYWKAAGGVVAYTKYPNGYDPNSRREYPNSLIDVLVKVRG